MTHTRRLPIPRAAAWPLLIVASICLALGTPTHARAEGGIVFQDGLPPELVIDTSRPLPEQLTELTSLREWAEKNTPKPGFLDSLKGVVSGAKGPTVVTIETITEHLGDVQGQVLSTYGLYNGGENDEATLISSGGDLPISVGGGVTPEGFPSTEIDGLPVVVTGIVESTKTADGYTASVRASKITPCGWLASLRTGRIHEMEGTFEKAVEAYEAAAALTTGSGGSEFVGFCLSRGAQIALDHLDDKAKARALYNRAWDQCAGLGPDGTCPFSTWMPATERWAEQPLRQVVGPSLDALNSTQFKYKIVDFFIGIAGGNAALGIVLIAVIVRLLVWPLSKKQLESAHAMQRLQPQIKALQEKYVEDKQKFQAEFWKLCQANGVNPLGGCLPMLVQFPILIMLYQGIRAYIWHFDGTAFIWVKNLAGPDLPLLIIYAISMIFYQKLVQATNPSSAMNPEQAQQQKMMTWMMPVMFFFFFRTLPSAFILYWLASNVIYAAEHYIHSKVSPRDGEPAPKKSGGFVSGMVKLMSSGKQDNDGEEDEPRDSYSVREAAADGKKVGKAAKTKSGTRK